MGNIRVLEEGLELNNIEKSKRDIAVRDYFVMKYKAERNGDSFWALESIYDKSYSFGNIVSDFLFADWTALKSLGFQQPTIQLIQSFSKNIRTGKIQDIDEFEIKPKPLIRAGFRMDIINDDYIFDTLGWIKWHDDWYRNNLDQLYWDNVNELFHDYEKSIGILREALQKKKNEDFEPLKTIDVKYLSDKNVTNVFHELVMKRMSSGERIAYTKEIGKAVCEANYYRYEEVLSRLEEKMQNELNHKDVIREIYSITKDAKRQFISLDTQHGMLEFHNEKGEHLGEYRFDGTFNSPREENHGLIAIHQWEKQLEH